MTLDQKQNIALFRYAVIAPLETGTSDPSISNNEFFRQAAKKTYTGPDGKPQELNFVRIDGDLNEIIADEKTRRTEAYNSVVAHGPNFKSSNYGTRHPAETAATRRRTMKTKSPP